MVTVYKLTEKNEASREFGRLFGLPLGDFYDPIVSIWTLKVCIDIVKLDERMHQEWSDYEEKGQSLFFRPALFLSPKLRSSERNEAK